ncbi:hypothetical protein [Lichenihabitans psoromatis]|nr:hypothetical protein [Lichenihabitans psoromatis]
MTHLQFYRVAVAISVLVNVLLIAGIWAYLHFKALLSIIKEAMSFLR